MLANKKSWKVMIITLVAVLTISVLSACGDKKDVVATYKGGEITLEQYNLEKSILTFLSPQMAQLTEMDEFKTYLLNQQVAFGYLSDNATAESKTTGKKLAEEQLAGMKAQVGDDKFKLLIEESKLTEADIAGYLEKVMISMEDMNRKVTDADIKADYDANKQDYTLVSLRHILISLEDADGKAIRTAEEALKVAKDVKSQLDKGGDFATLAKKYSEDPGSKEEGGLYKDTPAGTWVDAFKESSLTLPLNQISDPIETEYGYHVMTVESRTETAFDKITQEQKDAIKNKLGSVKIDEFMSNDLPGIIKKVNLPESPAATTEEPTTTPESGQDPTGTNGTTTEGTDAPKTDGTKTEDTDAPKTDDTTTDGATTDAPTDTTGK
ncbi:foldase protein PrsA [Paenibacillus sp. DS2015]|uniref:peptidylprolyl isomerase n=1 Tax=Paenibacillus sp. DS2015 TaxID=3373917 RepID=UPI003D20BBFB